MLERQGKGERTRDRERTRSRLLEVAFHEFWQRGYTATSVDEIIAQTEFTKGAFYHHFPSKKQLACAVIDEAVGGLMQSRWVSPYADLDDPLAALCDWLRAYQDTSCEFELSRGCPLNNIAQELAATDPEIRGHVDSLFRDWIAAMASLFERCKTSGILRSDVDSQAVAVFFVASFEGGISLTKAMHSALPYKSVLSSLVEYLEALRTKPAAKQSNSKDGRSKR